MFLLSYSIKFETTSLWPRIKLQKHRVRIIFIVKFHYCLVKMFNSMHKLAVLKSFSLVRYVELYNLSPLDVVCLSWWTVCGNIYIAWSVSGIHRLLYQIYACIFILDCMLDWITYLVWKIKPEFGCSWKGFICPTFLYIPLQVILSIFHWSFFVIC